MPVLAVAGGYLHVYMVRCNLRHSAIPTELGFLGDLPSSHFLRSNQHPSFDKIPKDAAISGVGFPTLVFFVSC